MPEIPPSGAPARQSLADWLDARRDRIVADWMQAVAEDKHIPNADHLTMSMLQDHLPEMFAEFIVTLREPAPEAADADASRTGHAHGKTRWRHGYRLDEVLRELARVREILLARIRQFCDERRADLLRDEAEVRTRHFFDRVVAASARQFMTEQYAELTLRGQQLQRAYEQVEAATEQLRIVAQSRLRLLRGVSHELRNALQAVGLSAEALLDTRDDASHRTLILQLNDSAIRLQRLLDRLQMLSAILAGEVRLQIASLDLRVFFADLEKAHRAAAEGKELALQLTGAAEIGVITTDRTNLQHIADILITNATLYTERGWVRVSAIKDDPGRWILRVEDTGAGIDAINARLIFNEFHRQGPVQNQGIGLGLVLARHLAHLLDGEITFTSTPGAGSKFDVHLPLHLTHAPPLPELLPGS
jgi:signal transduction histidine kinase